MKLEINYLKFKLYKIFLNKYLEENSDSIIHNEWKQQKKLDPKLSYEDFLLKVITDKDTINNFSLIEKVTDILENFENEQSLAILDV
jgi:hypothetical protein